MVIVGVDIFTSARVRERTVIGSCITAQVARAIHQVSMGLVMPTNCIGLRIE